MTDERKGARRDIDEMTRRLVEAGNDPRKAREIARRTAGRVVHDDPRCKTDREKKDR